jgi:transposase
VRWVVKRAFAWLHQFKWLRIRYQRRADLHEGLLELATSFAPPSQNLILKRSVRWLEDGTFPAAIAGRILYGAPRFLRM